jgi:hypothetical protein
MEGKFDPKNSYEKKNKKFYDGPKRIYLAG